MGFNGDLIDIPSGYVKIAIENGHWNSELAHKKLGDFPWLCKRLPEGNLGKQTRNHWKVQYGTI